jgi:hypothetical protein
VAKIWIGSILFRYDAQISSSSESIFLSEKIFLKLEKFEKYFCCYHQNKKFQEQQVSMSSNLS